MRTDEQRIAAMHTRAMELNRQKRARQVRIMQWTSSVFSLCAVIALAAFMPQLTSPEGGSVVVSPGDMHASIFGSSAAAGYVVIGVIAFLLGVSVTVFCFSLKNWQNAKNAADEEETGGLKSAANKKDDASES